MSNALSLEKKQTILIVDDTPDNLMLQSALLSPSRSARRIMMTRVATQLNLRNARQQNRQPYPPHAALHSRADTPAAVVQASADDVDLRFKSVPLHDIGKAGVPDRILLKPDKLDDEEFAIMKLHTVYGRDAILQMEKYLGGSNEFLRVAREIAYSHQEKWDGSGYPEGLRHEQAMAVMREGRGTHFDFDILDAPPWKSRHCLRRLHSSSVMMRHFERSASTR